MPTVFNVKGFRFFFFSDEGREPLHIHVEKGEKYAKFWLYPVALAYNYRFNSPELGFVARIIEERGSEIEERWNEHFRSG